MFGKRPIETVSNRQPNKLAIIELVVASKPGELIADADIDRVTGAKLAVWNNAMQAARRVLSIEHGIELKRERELRGYRHLKANEKPGAADSRMRRARNQVKVANRIVDSVTDEQFAALSAPEQVVHVQTRARTALALDMLSAKKQKAIARTVTNGKERATLPK